MGETFEQARSAAPCILLIDEIDAIWNHTMAPPSGLARSHRRLSSFRA
ncbi:MAG: AAA family ATPase [Gallionella sp.]|nr:AAA family ATPase [Gallionella sp.]